MTSNATPSWWVGPPKWFLEEPRFAPKSNLVLRDSAPVALRFQADGAAAAPVLEGRMMPYLEWTEIRSSVEGHFFERFAPGALTKTMKEQRGRIRALFDHGLDQLLGRQPIAVVDDLWDQPDGAYFRASLLKGVPDLLVEGLRNGLYGSSIRFAALKTDRVRFPLSSDHNPSGLPEVTVREARLQEFSVVAFPAYAGATATVLA